MEKKENSAKRFLIDSVKGVTLGISCAIAGLSAGTIAVSEKCYDTIIGAIGNLRKSFKVNFLILLPFVLGTIVGALGALIGIQRGYQAAPFSLTGFFAGCVIGSLPVALAELKKGADAKEKTIHILAFLLSFLVAAGLGIITAMTKFDLAQYLNARVFWIYPLTLVAGFIAAGACIVPGISGSMTLMVLGMYYPILNTFTGDNSIWHSNDATTIVTGLLIALLFAIGALAGVVASSKFMKHMLSNHRVSTFYSILGLILGSLISMFINSSIFPLYQGYTDSNNVFHQIQTWDYIVGSVLFVIGAALVFFIVRLSSRQEKASEAEETESQTYDSESK